ncbi:MAG: PspC domain-containing protein [Ruminococcaceae bacterium]|nr:PspC domain-containing protein [Oscillospiraceae bacterium]
MENKKRLCKVQKGKKICGVCAGIAQYFNTDPTYIRLAWAFFVLCLGTGILAYLLCAFILPNEDEV